MSRNLTTSAPTVETIHAPIGIASGNIYKLRAHAERKKNQENIIEDSIS